MNADDANYWTNALTYFQGSTLDPRTLSLATKTISLGVVPRSPLSPISPPKSSSLKRALRPTFLEIPKPPMFIKQPSVEDDDDFSPWSFNEEMEKEGVPEWRRTPSSTYSSSSNSSIGGI